MGDLTPPYLTWPTTTTTGTITPILEAPCAFISSEELNHEYSLPSPSTSFEENLSPANMSTLTLCGDAEISDLMLADLCVGTFFSNIYLYSPWRLSRGHSDQTPQGRCIF